MKFSHFFIRRPIFASVLSILIVLLGAIALFTLPIAQYPEITPPTIFVIASYPGASAETVANTVATPLEEQINGVENMLYMSAQCSSDGQMRLAVTFKVGTDPNTAQVLVQNRVDGALPRMPEEVRALGVITRKRSPTIAMLVSLISPSGKYDPVYLSNYAYLHVRDVLARLPGVGDSVIFGARDYCMRIWIDPNKASARNLTASDIVAAIRRQNVEVAAGLFGQAPQPPDNLFQLAVVTKGRLVTPEEFGDIVLKARGRGPDHPAAGRRAHRAGGRRLQHRQPAQRATGGGDCAVPAAGLQRHRDRQRHRGGDEGAEEGFPRRAGLPHRFRHLGLHPRVHPGRDPNPDHRRSFSWYSSSCCSSRTGGRR